MAKGGHTCEFMVPGLFTAPPRDWLELLPERARLERLLVRGDPWEAPAADPVANLLVRFGCAPAQDPPLGPLSFLGEGGDPGDGFWFCAAPVLLHPDRALLVTRTSRI